MSTETTNVLDVLERYYQPQKLLSMALKKAPLTAYFPKDENAQGETCVMRFLTSDAGGTAATVSGAIAAEASDGYKKALFDWKLAYTSWTLGLPALKRSQGSGQLVDLLQMGLKTTMNRHGMELETAMFGAGNMQLGKRASASTNIITLSDPLSAFNFVPGQVLLADDTSDGSSPRTGTAVVVSVDYTNGKVTVDNAAGITSFADSDFLFLNSFQAWAPGIQSIIPVTAPGVSDSFGGLNRSLAPEMLSGWRFSGTAGDTVTETLIKALSWGSDFGGVADTVFLSTNKHTQLVLEQANKCRYDNMKSEKYGITFKGVVLDGPDGDVLCIHSPKCPDSYGWALERDSWKLQSVQEPLIAVATKTGKYLDVPDADDIRLRWRSQFGLVCSMPVHNGAITW